MCPTCTMITCVTCAESGGARSHTHIMFPILMERTISFVLIGQGIARPDKSARQCAKCDTLVSLDNDSFIQCKHFQEHTICLHYTKESNMPVRHACPEAVEMTFFDPLKQANNTIIAKVLLAQRAKIGKTPLINFFLVDNLIDLCSGYTPAVPNSQPSLLYQTQESFNQVCIIDLFDFSGSSDRSNIRICSNIIHKSAITASTSSGATIVTTLWHRSVTANCSAVYSAGNAPAYIQPGSQAQVHSAHFEGCQQSCSRRIYKRLQGSLQKGLWCGG